MSIDTGLKYIYFFSNLQHQAQTDIHKWFAIYKSLAVLIADFLSE